MHTQSEKRFVVWVIAAFLTGCVIGGLFRIRRAATNNRDFVRQFDNNIDGNRDAESFFEKGVVVRAQQDRNFDGKWDYFEWYEQGIIAKAESDDDFDGKIDGWLTYKSGNLDSSKHDLDGNGEPDVIQKYVNGVIRLSLCRPNGATNNVRIEFYKGGVIEKEYRDADGDGLIETLVIYDRFGSEARREKVMPALAPTAIKVD